jgi:hypothetical protein
MHYTHLFFTNTKKNVIFWPLFCYFKPNYVILRPPIFFGDEHFLGPVLSYLAENSAFWLH